MKKTQIIFLLLLAVFSGCKNLPPEYNFTKDQALGIRELKMASTPIDYCALTNDEDSLDFSIGKEKGNVYMYSLNDLTSAEAGFRAFFKYNPDPQAEEELGNPTVFIKISDIAGMIDTIKAKTKYSPDTCFSAIKVHYALQNKKMVFLCEPIALKHHKDDAGPCEPDTTGIYYIADSLGNFTPVTDSIKVALTKNYRDSVSITHFKRRFFWWIVPTDDRRFRSGNDDYEYDDTRFCIMPLQQIVRAYRENLPKSDCKKGNENDYISFRIVANNYFTRARLFKDKKIINYKVHIVAYYGTLRNSNFDKGFQGLGADFGQMCPPNCETVQIPQYLKREKNR